MCVVWGIPYLLIRVAVREVTPATLVFLRCAAASAFLLPLAAARHELAAVLVAAVPFVGVVIAAATRSRERLDRVRATGLVVGIVGVAAIVGFDVGSTSGAGLAEIAGVVDGYAAGPWVLARSLADLPSLGVIAASLGTCAVAYAPVAALQLPRRLPGSHALLSIAALAVICTALAFVLFFELIAEVGPVRATVITYVNPAVAAVLGVAVLHERLTAGMGAGFVLVLAGSVLATRAERQALVAEP